MLSVTNTSDLTRYVPVPVGNGDISALIDYQGAQFQRNYPGIMVPGCLRAGFRYDNFGHNLLSFGYFIQDLPAVCGTEPVTWSQSLNPANGMVESLCRYADGLEIRSTIFCHPQENVIAVRKQFSRRTAYSFRYIYGTPRHVRTWCDEGDNAIHYSAEEQEKYEGSISLTSSISMDGKITPEEIVLSGEITEADFFLRFRDGHARGETAADDFESLRKSALADWTNYWAESCVKIPSPRVQDLYESSQYHLRISSTRWSIPTGIFTSHWEGRYFGFDEYWAASGLLSSGHLEAVRRICQFRKDVLHWAISRASSEGQECARYPWETLENGLEGTPPGPWMDHIFHMGVVTVTVREYFRRTHDLAFLRETGYPVVRACAEFFRLNACYQTADGRMEIGACQDFEKLGAVCRNPLATLCSAVAAFRFGAKCCELLGCDGDRAALWLDCAGKLMHSLPNDGTKLLAYPGCSCRTIALLTPFLPFNVLDHNDVLWSNGARDAMTHCEEYANQFRSGKVLTTWYAGLHAQVLLELGEREQAKALIEDAALHTGCFAAAYEVWETKRCPWFTTAEGVFVNAVNQLLLAGEKCGKPVWSGARFKLMDENGTVVERG